MNKNGQTLIIFVILIPIIILMLAVVVDVGLYTYEFHRTRGIIDTGIEEYFLTSDEHKIKDILELNDVSTEHLIVSFDKDVVDVKIEYKMDSLFGKIIRLDSYDVIIYRTGIFSEGKVIKKEGKGE